MCSNYNPRKYTDAILWGSSEAKQTLPSSFYNDIDKFLKSFKKETKKAAKDGLLDEHEADPISWTHLNFVIQWDLEKGGILIRVFFVLKWNCMSRSINIGALAYHNFQTGDDYIKIIYDKTKSDQAVERVSVHMLFSNLFNCLV